MRAAPLVLTLALLTVLVRADRDVLGAVVLRELPRSAATAGRGEEAREQLLTGERLARPQQTDDDRAPEQRGRHTGLLERQPRVRKRPAHYRQEREELGHLERAAQEAAVGLGRGRSGFTPDAT